MNNNKICPGCGAKNNINAKFCISCGTKLVENTNTNVNNEANVENNSINTNPTPVVNNGVSVQTEKDKRNATLLGVLSLVFYFVGSSLIYSLSYMFKYSFEELYTMISTLGGLSPIAGIVLMIVGRIKYPTNKFLKVVMWIIIGSIIAGLVLFILLVVFCYVTCGTMNTSGCG